MTNWGPKIRSFFQFQRGILFQYGWLKAWWAGRPVDAKGEPLPWITYPAIDFLTQFDFSDSRVFEWGSGFSTLWWSGRCKQITSVESNLSWIPYIRTMLPEQVELLTPEFSAEAEVAALAQHPTERFDVIVIDNNGPFRQHCAAAAPARLALGGMIILDNSDQCLAATAVLRREGFTQIDFTGYVPGGGYPHTTSFFFKQQLNFRTLRDYQPERSIAQPNPPWENC